MKVDRCTVCATTIYDGDDEVCRHGWRTCLACDPRDACEECNAEWLAAQGDGDDEPDDGLTTEERLLRAIFSNAHERGDEVTA